MPQRPSSPFFRALGVVAALLLPCGCGSSGGGDAGPPLTPTPPTPPPPTILSLTNFQPAAQVLGQPDLVSAKANQGGMPAANTLSSPSVAEPSGLFIVDSANHRVLGFQSMPTTNNANADFVLGQVDFLGNQGDQGGAPGADTLHFPFDAAVVDGALFVVDGGNHRVLIWNTVPTTTATPADVVIGQPNFTSQSFGTTATTMIQPRDIAVAGGFVVVSDQINHRVLIYHGVPSTNGVAADLVLGQADFVSGLENRGLGMPAADRMSNPSGVWTDGTRLAVADQGNSRVLIWTTFPTMNGQPADLVLGQADLVSNATATSATGMRYPTSVDSNGIQLFVGDAGSSRVLVWNTFPTMTGAAADVVLGQSDFVHGHPNDDDQNSVPDANPTARTLDTAGGSLQMRLRVYGSQLFVSDTHNNRLLRFDG